LIKKDTTKTVLEILLALVLIRFVLLALAFMFLVPKQEVQHGEVNDKNSIRFEIVWESGKDVDVDLWVMDPTGEMVGWSHKNGKNIDLVRDDLGNFNDPTGINMEIAFARNAPDGEYVVNVHLYDNRQKDYSEVPVKGVIWFRSEDNKTGGVENSTYVRDVILTRVGEEQTLIRFRIKDKKVVKSSYNTVYKPIYGSK
jgi:hypothetical protein